MTQTNKESQLNSHFLIIWFGQFISSIGSGLTAFALGIYVFHLTGSATTYSMVLLAAFLPALILKPVGGTLSDRMNRRLLMIIGDLGTALGIIFIILMMFVGIKGFWVIYCGTVVSSIFVAVQNPAYKASVTDLVSKEFYSKASGLMQVAESSKFLISPIIAGFLFKIMDVKAILIIDVMTFLIAISTSFYIKSNYPVTKQEIATQHFCKDFTDGFSYLFKNKSILLLISIISFITFFIGLLQALLGPMILSFTDSVTFGVSQTIATTGMLIGSSFIGVFGKSNQKIRILSVSLILSGVFFSLLGISANIITITVFGFLFFLVLPFINTSLDVLVRGNVENYMQGRIWSIVSLISQLGMAVAFAIAGYLADKVFNPLLEPNGALASSVGAIIGTGTGRGIGLIFILSGLFVVITAIVISRLKMLKILDNSQVIS
ncbi:MAG: transporter [Gammaproteobacteria bacterium]|jgi:MFS family permease|nr:transporter [Gammaproteobacteria bacterium]